jgi:predicted transcriptional regulator
MAFRESARLVCLSASCNKVVLSLSSIVYYLRAYVTTGWEKGVKIAPKRQFGEFEPVMTYVIINMTYVIFIYFSNMIKSNGEPCLILPCEVAVRSVIPAVRALIAKELMEEQGLKQDQVAEILGVSQSAVSKYSRKVRGHAIEVDDIEEIRPFINDIVILLLDRTGQSAELLQLFCQACIVIRKTSLMCAFCQKSDPKIKIEECGFCTNPVSKRR